MTASVQLSEEKDMQRYAGIIGAGAMVYQVAMTGLLYLVLVNLSLPRLALLSVCWGNVGVGALGLAGLVLLLTFLPGLLILSGHVARGLMLLILGQAFILATAPLAYSLITGLACAG